MIATDLGFAIHESVFDVSAMHDVLRGLSEAGISRSRAGARHVLRVPVVRQLASAPMLLDIARRYLGSSAFAFRATLFDKSPASNWLVTWHQDTALPVAHRFEVPGWGPWTMKGGVLHAIAPAAALDRIIALRVHLDDSTATNGPLRVLPGTHTRGVLRSDAIERLAAVIPPVDCVVNAGGVVAMRPLTVHSSSKAQDSQPRRVLHIEYADRIHLDPPVMLAVG